MLACILMIDPMIASDKAAVLIEVPLGVLIYFAVTWILRDRFLMDFILGRMLKGIIGKLKHR